MIIGRICTMILIAALLYFIQIMGMLFMSGTLDEESISEKIGIFCTAFSLFFPIVLSSYILGELIENGLI